MRLARTALNTFPLTYVLRLSINVSNTPLARRGLMGTLHLSELNLTSNDLCSLKCSVYIKLIIRATIRN